MWRDLNQNVLTLKDPWMEVGDFNSVVDAEESTNPKKISQNRCLDFANWIFDHSLLDMGFIGSKFTWTRVVSSNTFTGA